MHFSVAFVLCYIEMHLKLILMNSRGQGHLVTLAFNDLAQRSLNCCLSRLIKEFFSDTSGSISDKFYIQFSGKEGQKVFTYLVQVT